MVLQRFRALLLKIDIRPNRFYPNKSATMLITDGYYEIRSDLPWIFGDFDGNRAESLQ